MILARAGAGRNLRSVVWGSSVILKQVQNDNAFYKNGVQVLTCMKMGRVQY